MRNVLVIGCLLAATVPASAEPPAPQTPAEIKAAAKSMADRKRENDRKLDEAFAKSDADAFSALVGKSVKLKGLWFPSDGCREKFGGRKTVARADAPALAACLFELKLKNVADKGLVHEPGGTVYAGWNASELVGLSTVEIDPASPTVDTEVFDKHAKRKLDVKRDRKTAALMKQNPELAIVVEVRACVDAKGKVDALEVTTQTPQGEDYRATVEKAAKKWAFKPFKHGGKAIRVCAFRYFELYDGEGVLGGEEGGVFDDPVPTPPPAVKR
jgi:hypothetical protein